MFLMSQARVVGDIRHKSLSIESGAFFAGRSMQTRAANGLEPERASREQIPEIKHPDREIIAAE